MILAKPIKRGSDGPVLIGEGTELTEALLERLDRMGVDMIAVRTVEGAAEAEVARVFKDRLERLDHLFRQQADDRFTTKAKVLIREYLKRKIAEGEGC
jgi:hypothetical protein